MEPPAFIRKHNASGALVWGGRFGTAEYAEGVAAGSNGAYVVGSKLRQPRRVALAGGTCTPLAGTNQGGGYVYKLGSYLWGTNGVLGSISGGSDAFLRQMRSSNGSTLWTGQ